MNPHESQTAVSVPLVWALASTPAARAAIADLIFAMTGLPWLGCATGQLDIELRGELAQRHHIFFMARHSYIFRRIYYNNLHMIKRPYPSDKKKKHPDTNPTPKRPVPLPIP